MNTSSTHENETTVAMGDGAATDDATSGGVAGELVCCSGCEQELVTDGNGRCETCGQLASVSDDEIRLDALAAAPGTSPQ